MIRDGTAGVSIFYHILPSVKLHSKRNLERSRPGVDLLLIEILQEVKYPNPRCVKEDSSFDR